MIWKDLFGTPPRAKELNELMQSYHSDSNEADLMDCTITYLECESAFLTKLVVHGVFPPVRSRFV